MKIIENSLGSCCICGENKDDVRNLMSLDLVAPERGKGWGCIVCDLPQDGAFAVLCDACLEQFRAGKLQLRRVVTGYPGEDRRVPIEKLPKIEFKHDLKKHVIEDSYELI